MLNLDRWIACYIAMDARGRRKNLMLMEDDASRNPAPTTKLTAITGGLSGSAAHKQLGSLQNLRPIPVISLVVKGK